jgi:hypothetical protein
MNPDYTDVKIRTSKKSIMSYTNCITCPTDKFINLFYNVIQCYLMNVVRTSKEQYRIRMPI